MGSSSSSSNVVDDGIEDRPWTRRYMSTPARLLLLRNVRYAPRTTTHYAPLRPSLALLRPSTIASHRIASDAPASHPSCCCCWHPTIATTLR